MVEPSLKIPIRGRPKIRLKYTHPQSTRVMIKIPATKVQNATIVALLEEEVAAEQAPMQDTIITTTVEEVKVIELDEAAVLELAVLELAVVVAAPVERIRIIRTRDAVVTRILPRKMIRKSSRNLLRWFLLLSSFRKRRQNRQSVHPMALQLSHSIRTRISFSSK